MPLQRREFLQSSLLWTAQLAAAGGMSRVISADESLVSANLTESAPDINALRAAMNRGLRWLCEQQGSDGGWHSETYGSLKNGLGQTALIVAVLSEVNDSTYQWQKCRQKGFQFLNSHVSSRGLVEMTGGDAEYPVYSTALFLTLMTPEERKAQPQLAEKLIQGLLGRQRIEANGWPGETIQSGGWGAGAELLPDDPFANPANVSVTVHVLAALHKTGQITPAIREAALEFLSRCQLDSQESDGSGGFCFTPQQDHPLNKAGWLRDESGRLRARPYQSATCDGLLALHYAGSAVSEAEFRKVTNALLQLNAPELPANPLETGSNYAHTQAIWFYDAAALGQVWKCFSELQKNVELRRKRASCLEVLLNRQHRQGYWFNPLTWMMEDDPLLATAQAVSALLRLIES